MARNFRRFRTTDVGRSVLIERKDLIQKLTDRDYLASLNPNSLGYAYLQFTESEQISADGLEQASIEAGVQSNTADFDLFIRRVRCSHDLFHVLTQYGRDGFGELCLLAFTYAQAGNPGILFILTMSSFRLIQHVGLRGIGALWCGYQDGKHAGWLIAADWESLLEEPLTLVRKQFGIGKPSIYFNILTDLNATPVQRAT